MIYVVLRIFILLGFRSYLKRLNWIGYENIPKNKAILMAPNHSNAFLDAVVIGANSFNDYYYLVRSDVFKNPIAAWWLKALHQTPIYRIRDGVDQLKENEKTFSKVFELLEAQQRVMIFPEGDCVQEKKLRPLKKGLARMSFNFMENNNWVKDLYVVPVGINYDSHTKFRANVTVVFEKPIRVANYFAVYQENERKALVKLTNDVAAGIKKALIEVEPEKEPHLSKMLHFFDVNMPKPKTWKFQDERSFVNKKMLSELSESPLKDSLGELWKAYEKLKSELKTSDEGIAAAATKKNYLLVLVFIAPLAGLGYVLNSVFFNLSTKLADKNAKNIEFYSSLRLGGLVGLYLFLGIACLIAALFIPIVYALALPLIFYFSGLVSIYFIEKIRIQKALHKFQKASKQTQKQVLLLREEIFNNMQQVI